MNMDISPGIKLLVSSSQGQMELVIPITESSRKWLHLCLVRKALLSQQVSCLEAASQEPPLGVTP